MAVSLIVARDAGQYNDQGRIYHMAQCQGPRFGGNTFFGLHQFLVGK